MQVSGAVSPQLHYFELLAAPKLLPWQGQLLSRAGGETEFVTTILETVCSGTHSPGRSSLQPTGHTTVSTGSTLGAVLLP